MIVAFDTDVLIAWAMAGTPRHRRVRQYVDRLVGARDRIGLTAQVAWEFLHVCTDAKRFEVPLAMSKAIDLVRDLRASDDVCDIAFDAAVVDRALELLDQHRLGRKRILDTVLAASLEAAGVATLVTFDAKDFAVFPFLKTVAP